MSIVNKKIIKKRLLYILKSPLFWVGTIIRIISLIYLLNLNRDLNDMNEIVIQALERLLNGQNPYELGYEYTLHVNTHYYDYHFGYPPVVLVLYLVTMIYPNSWGISDFCISFFILNVFYDILCLLIIVEPDKKFSKYLMIVYWSIPLLSYADYVTFYSSTFLLIFASLRYIDNPFKSSLFLFLCVGSYHLMALMIPIQLVYYYRTYRDNQESAKIYHKEIEEYGKKNIFTNMIGALKISSLVKAIKRALKDLKMSFKDNTKKIILGLLPTLLIFLPFIIWDFPGLKFHLFDASSNRYNFDSTAQLVNILKIIFIIWVVFSVTVQALIEKKYIAKIWLSFSTMMSYFFLALYLWTSLGFSYPHYFALMIPFGFHFAYDVIYEFKEFHDGKNKKIEEIEIHEKLTA